MGLSSKRRIIEFTEKATGTHSFRIQEKNIVCPQSSYDRFEIGSALLNTAGMTFMKLDWVHR
jgi:hypothetical protein